MFKFIGIVLLVCLAIAGYFWYSAQALPDWFEDRSPEDVEAIERLSEEINRQGVKHFLGDKLADVKNGKVVFSEQEFNALFLASLKLDEDGQKLLAVSDAVTAILHDGEVEFGAIINLDKVEKIDANARKAVEKANRIFPFLEDSLVALTVYATPVARGGEVGVKDDFHIKVGAIPITNNSLRQLGVPVERAEITNLALRYMSVNDIVLADGQVTFDVRPRL